MTRLWLWGPTLVLIVASLAGCGPPRDGAGGEAGENSPGRWQRKRDDLVDSLANRGISNEGVLASLREVPRHLFVPGELAEFAYSSGPLEIGEGQTISSPFVVAYMTEMLELDGGEKVLEIGTGSGYQAAVLSKIVPEVYSIEIRPALADAARKRLGELGFGNVTVKCGDGYKGWPEHAPFDAIIVTASPEEIPRDLVDQLANGGRLIVPVGSQSGNQRLILVRKDASGAISREPVQFVKLAPMIRGGVDPEAPEEERQAAKRRSLVDILRGRGIEDTRVVKALLEVPRHRFVPDAQVEHAYENRPLFIGEGQTISAPYIVGFMTQILKLDGSEKVLEIGTGSGYQAAVLSMIVPEVYTIEIRSGLAASATSRLKELDYAGVQVRCGDGYKGWPEHAPFDAIIVTAAPEVIPAALVEQLAPGGRLIVPVGPQSENQKLTLLTKDESGTVRREVVLPVRFVPMIHGK